MACQPLRREMDRDRQNIEIDRDRWRPARLQPLTTRTVRVPYKPYPCRTSTVRVLYDLVSAANLRTPQAAYIPYTLSCLMCRLHHLARPGRQAEAWCCVGPHGVRKAAGLGLSDRDAEHGRLVSGAVGPTVGTTVGRGVAELVRHEKRRQRIHRSWRLLRGLRGDFFVATASWRLQRPLRLLQVTACFPPCYR